MKQWNLLLLLLCVSFSLVACGGITSPQESDATEFFVAATQTLGAQLEIAKTAESLAIPEQISPTPTMVPSSTLAPTTATPTAPTPATMTTRVGTSCRWGPSTTYNVASDLPAGNTYAITGINESEKWLKIESSDSDCWVYVGDNIMVQGDVRSLPVLKISSLPTNTPRPTAAPGFQLGRALLNSCGSKKIAAFPITAVGNITFKSGRIRISDTETLEILNNNSNNLFFHGTDFFCEPGDSELLSNITRYAIADISKTQAGRTYRAVVTLCTQNGLKGDCYKLAVVFTR